jgi:hypothetical protein
MLADVRGSTPDRPRFTPTGWKDLPPNHHGHLRPATARPATATDAMTGRKHPVLADQDARTDQPRANRSRPLAHKSNGPRLSCRGCSSNDAARRPHRNKDRQAHSQDNHRCSPGSTNRLHDALHRVRHQGSPDTSARPGRRATVDPTSWQLRSPAYPRRQRRRAFQALGPRRSYATSHSLRVSPRSPAYV